MDTIALVWKQLIALLRISLWAKKIKMTKNIFQSQTPGIRTLGNNILSAGPVK